MSQTEEQTHAAIIAKLTRKDIRAAAATIDADEARFLCEFYQDSQNDRIRFNNQERSMDGKPNLLLKFLGSQAAGVEETIKKALFDYASNHKVGAWLVDVHGIGPVLAAGLLAHIDIKKAPTVGHIWRFAGLDPTVSWDKGVKRPFNAKLKKLCWLIGQSFMKTSGSDKSVYGKLYRERKQYEVSRNDNGGNASMAESLLKRFGKDTEAYQHLLAGKLPPAQLDARARRWAVKIFLSHLHDVWYRAEFGVAPPKPFAIAILGHAHLIPVPV